MRRIKEYINNHPKLKRIAKILCVIAIVFSFIFNALIIGSLIINANHQKEDNTTQVLTYGDYKNIPQPKHYIDSRFSVYYGLGDFLSETFAQYQYLALSTGEGLSNPDNIGNTGLGVSDFLQGTMLVITRPQDTFLAYMNDNGDTLNSLASDAPNYNVCIQKDVTTTFDRYYIWYLYTSNNNLYRYTFCYSRYYISETNYTNWSTSVLIEQHDNGTWTGNFIGVNNSRVYFNFAKNEYFNWLYNTHDYYNSAYNEGYANGIEVGSERGYDEGYEYGYGQGYYDGIQSAEQGDSTMFTLIAQAFNAVASILDIQILPNLSLGLLIFTPLIVTIIIVIVKMVKG